MGGYHALCVYAPANECYNIGVILLDYSRNTRSDMKGGRSNNKMQAAHTQQLYG